MTEAEYVLVSDLRTVRVIVTLLRDVVATNNPCVDAQQYGAVNAVLRRWEERMEALLRERLDSAIQALEAEVTRLTAREAALGVAWQAMVGALEVVLAYPNEPSYMHNEEVESALALARQAMGATPAQQSPPRRDP